MCEEHKVAARNIRRDSNELLKGFKKDGDISEDDAFKAQDSVQKVTDEFIANDRRDLQRQRERNP
jgi:ribosome recycling factor